jgi:hypothetical protein
MNAAEALRRARERHRFAKERFSAAAQAALDGPPNAAEQAAAALAEVKAARTQLQRLAARDPSTPHAAQTGP